MPKTLTMEDRGRMMLEDRVSSVIPRLALPSIISMLISSIYNMADTFFVGRISTTASGAVGVVFSAMSIIQAIAFTFGMGSGANMSRCLGSHEDERAVRFAHLGFFSSFFTGFILCALGLLFLEPIVRFLGATPTILPEAMSYATWIFLAAPFMMGTFTLNNLLRFQGLALYGTIGTGIGGILNMFLDPLLIFIFHMGVTGAALATAISQVVSFVILVTITNTRKDALSLTPKGLHWNGRMFVEILYNGMPSLGRQGIASVATILLNNTAAAWGDPAIAAMSIVSRCVMFINSAIIGFGQGFQPVCAYCYGAGRYRRVREAFIFCIKVSTVILVVIGGIFLLTSGNVIQFFRDDPEVIEIGTLALRLQLCTLPLWGLITMSNMYSQSIGLGGRATLIAAARQGIFLIPLLLILPRTLGLLGLQAAQPIADILTFIFTLILVRAMTREMMNKTERTT